MPAKAELFMVPIFGWILASVGGEAVDRKKREEAIKALDGIAQNALDGRWVVSVNCFCDHFSFF